MASQACTGCRDGAEFPIPFGMAFQPIVDVHTGQPFAYEALVRGIDGSGAATILDAVTDENRYGFDQACRVRAIEGAIAAGILATDARLSINFLPNAVYSPLACIQLTLKTARESGLPSERLIFEFTENETMASPEHVGRIIETYKRIGFSVAMDDFGAGQSGLALFTRFAPDEIKLDISLVRGIADNAHQRAVVRAMVTMCQELGTLLIAEGIETAAEAAALRALGVRYHQGYYYARPALAALPPIAAHAFPTFMPGALAVGS